ncbi:MAG: alpha/beta fold hydrolase [Armatimonadetes bacterium]|nr:alpha/beta fold hydrolase [Armatimonadota bacterium]
MEHRQFQVEGQTITAGLHVPDTTPAPGVVMCHGFTGTRIEAHFLFVKAARELCAAGMNVLRFDFRGSGESDGAFEEMTVEGEIADALAAVEVLRNEPTVDPDRVAVLGLSLGGLVAACTAARSPNVSALVLWAAVADLMEVFSQRGDWDQVQAALKRDGFVEHGAHRIGAGFWEDCRRIDPLAELADYRGPALVVHGSEDQSVVVDHAQRYLDALPTDDKTVHIIEGADHTFSSVAWEREAIGVTTEWLARHLGCA